jgi:hypothetical protein
MRGRTRYGCVTRSRRNMFVEYGALFCTLTLTGVLLPVATTFVEFRPAPSIFVAMVVFMATAILRLVVAAAV